MLHRQIQRILISAYLFQLSRILKFSSICCSTTPVWFNQDLLGGAVEQDITSKSPTGPAHVILTTLPVCHCINQDRFYQLHFKMCSMWQHKQVFLKQPFVKSHTLKAGIVYNKTSSCPPRTSGLVHYASVHSSLYTEPLELGNQYLCTV